MKGNYSREEYEALFAERLPGQVAGEGSTHYLHHAETVAPLMASVVTDVRLVFCLREPVSRAHSHYLFHYSLTGPYVPGGFGSQVSFSEFARLPEIFSMGEYAAHLASFYEHFGRGQILVLFLDDLRRDLAGTLARICRHVGVDPEFPFDTSARENETAYARWPRLMPVLDRVASAAYVRFGLPGRRALLRARRRILFSASGPKPVVSPTVEAKLRDLYRPSVERLAEMTGKDLSSWMA